jgi:hypothetical protein
MKFLSVLLPVMTLLQVSAYQVPTLGNVGSTSPLPNFDPLKLSKNRDVNKLQDMEIKHGRVAMLASLGLITQQNFHPVYEKAGSLSIYHFQEFIREYPFFTSFLLTFIGILEGYSIQKAWKYPTEKFPAPLKEDYTPGKLINFEASDNLKNQEINHGRLGMLVSLFFIITELYNTNNV